MIDGLIALLVGLGAYAEARRGLFLALSDIVRAVLGLVFGFTAFSVVYRLSGSYAAGFIAFGIAALTGIFGVRVALHRLRLDPAWGRTPVGRVGGGVLGALLGCLIGAVFVPVAGRTPGGRDAVSVSFLARPFLEAVPALYHAADRFNLDMPMLNSRAIRFEDEGAVDRTVLVDRINYSRLDGSTCIECRSAVAFVGYHRRFEVAVSPKFACPVCGRTSDGCQTFEGFHRMYGRCPVDVAQALGPIDCGVWPNDRPVYPNGACPVDAESADGGQP